jgi:hypothetical protein
VVALALVLLRGGANMRQERRSPPLRESAQCR